MPIATHAGQRIHYSVEGEGPPLLLQHGSGSRLQAWTLFGYTARLRAQHCLIMVDARGHGESDKPHAVADYALDKRVGDLLAVLDHAGVGRAHYWGYSMGGWIGFGLAARAPERLASLVLGGAHPYADPAEAFLGVDGSDPEVFIAAMERFARIRATPEVRERLLQNDLRALAAAMHPRASQEAELPRMRTPALLYVGDQDPRLEAVRQCAAAMPQAQFLALPGLDHSSAFQRSASVVPQVLAFLASANNREP